MTNIKSKSKTVKNDLTLGQKLNNLTCIRYSRYNSWNGQIGSSKGFVKFISKEACIRATCIILCRYIFTYFSTSVSEIIYRWAPPSDGNDTKSYVQFVCNYIGQYLDFYDVRFVSGDADFYRFIMYVIAAIAKIESNSDLHSDFLGSKPLVLSIVQYCNEYCRSVLHVPTPHQALLKYNLAVPY